MTFQSQTATVAAPVKQRSFLRPSRPLQRKCACDGNHGPRSECEECHEKRLERQHSVISPLAASAVPSIVQEVLRSSGEPLDSAMRGLMEPLFGHDFSRVRVHTDARAASSARAVQARAYTVGRHVAFGPNEYAPATERGRGLLAHELAHTIQQRDAAGSRPPPDANGVFESSANAAARNVASGQAVSQNLPTCGFGLSRQATPDEPRAKALAEAKAVAARLGQQLEEADEDHEPTGQSASPKNKAPSKFSPGGFTDKEAEKLYKEAEDRTKLGVLALTLAEKQARRREFWEANRDDVKEAYNLDLYWDPQEAGFIRQAYVGKQEDVVMADPDAKRLYDSHLWDLTHNKPVKKSWLDSVVGFVCRNTEPCSGNMEQFHRDLESGMSREEATKRGMTRLTIIGATSALPGPGPSGPIPVGPRGTPGKMPFDVPVFETGKLSALEKPQVTKETSVPIDRPKTYHLEGSDERRKAAQRATG